MKRIRFQEQELIPVGTHYGYTFGTPVPAYHTPISAKENYMAMLRHERPCWIPTYDDFCVINPRVLIENVVHRAVHAANPTLEGDEQINTDMFGIEWEYVEVAGGSIVKPGNPRLNDVNEWKDNIHFPDITKWNWEEDARLNEEYLNNDQPKTSWIFSGFFERLISFMDFEEAVIAMIDEEQTGAIKELFSELCALYEQIILNLKKYYDVDVIFFHDDWGSQRAPFFSLNTCREMLVPYIKRLTDFCHNNGMFFELHCCGNNELLVPAMIEAGVDIWGGQMNANNFEMLREQYGDKIIFGIGAPIAPDASDEAAYESAREYVEKFCKDYQNKPVYFSGFVPHKKQREYLYVLSRKAFSTSEH